MTVDANCNHNSNANSQQRLASWHITLTTQRAGLSREPPCFWDEFSVLVNNKINKSRLAKRQTKIKKKRDDKIKSKKSTLREVGLEPATSPTSGL